MPSGEGCSGACRAAGLLPQFPPIASSARSTTPRLNSSTASRNATSPRTARRSSVSGCSGAVCGSRGFPIIADLDMNVANHFGMLHPASSDTSAVRAVFFIDPERRLRAMIYYPLNVGRNFDEVLRVIDALQTVDSHNVACPADWRPGEPVIVPPPATTEAAEKRVHNKEYDVTDWYFSKRKL